MGTVVSTATCFHGDVLRLDDGVPGRNCRFKSAVATVEAVLVALMYASVIARADWVGPRSSSIVRRSRLMASLAADRPVPQTLQQQSAVVVGVPGGAARGRSGYGGCNMCGALVAAAAGGSGGRPIWW